MTMVGETDRQDKKDTRNLFVVLTVLVVVLMAAVLLLLPMITDMAAVHFAPGLGFKSGAIIAFFATIVVLLLFALGAGDGLIGELQFVLPAFFAFFVVIWLLITWIF